MPGKPITAVAGAIAGGAIVLAIVIRAGLKIMAEVFRWKDDLGTKTCPVNRTSRDVQAVLLAPLAIIAQYADAGLWLIFPGKSDATYWEEYWEDKHKRSCKGLCAWKNTGVHTLGPHKLPADPALTVNKGIVWIGGY